MVIHTRLRSILFPLALYVVSGAIGGFFIWHAMNGGRGLKTRVANKAKIAELHGELAALRKERKDIELRVSMLQTVSVDRDLLDEETRFSLGRLHKNEVVVFLPRPDGK